MGLLICRGRDDEVDTDLRNMDGTQELQDDRNPSGDLNMGLRRDDERATDLPFETDSEREKHLTRIEQLTLEQTKVELKKKITRNINILKETIEEDQSDENELADKDDFELKIAFNTFEKKLSEALFNQFSFIQTKDIQSIYQKNFFKITLKDMEDNIVAKNVDNIMKMNENDLKDDSLFKKLINESQTREDNLEINLNGMNPPSSKTSEMSDEVSENQDDRGDISPETQIID